jgi:LacI family transcriptional regulator
MTEHEPENANLTPGTKPNGDWDGATPSTNAREKKATIHDVAKLAGVSYQTVSRVINASPRVAAETRERVMEAIRTLKFQPSQVARALISGRSRTLQLINFNPYTPLVGPLIMESERIGYRMVFSTPQKKDIREEIATLSAHQIDGFLLLTQRLDVTYEEIKESANDVPFVVLDADIGPEAPCVLIDQHHGIRLLVEHLLEMGHRQFAEIIGPATYYDAWARRQSYETTLREHGLPLGPVALSGHFTAEEGYQAAKQILQTGQPFTALVCVNDQSAVGAIHALRERGLRVPQDVSVTGFDDDLTSAHISPPLTTARQDYDALARQSLEHLLTLINQPDTPPYRRVLYPRLIIRESTAPPKTGV